MSWFWRSPNELLPCPFCGARATVREVFGKLAAGCNNDRCSIRPDTWLSLPDATDLAKVAKVWNRRAKVGRCRCCDSDAISAEDPKGLSGEAVAARAEGIATPTPRGSK